MGYPSDWEKGVRPGISFDEYHGVGGSADGRAHGSKPNLADELRRDGDGSVEYLETRVAELERRADLADKLLAELLEDVKAMSHMAASKSAKEKS